MQFKIKVDYTVSARNEQEARRKARQCLLSDEHVAVRKVEEPLTSPERMYRRLRFMERSSKELFTVIALDVRDRIVKKEVISKGILNANLVHPREVFQFAIMNNAAAIVVAHNHPSGDTEPSADDLDATTRLVTAGKVMGIAVLDHLIIGRHGYLSLKEHGYV